MKRQGSKWWRWGPPAQGPLREELGQGKAQGCEPGITELPRKLSEAQRAWLVAGGLGNDPFLSPQFSQAEVSQPGCN